MGNIHILPTTGDKSFGFCKRKDNNKFLLYPSTEEDHNQAEYQNIYITSDEEIKDNDFAFDIRNNDIVKQHPNQQTTLEDLQGGQRRYFFKIVLTTNRDLKDIQPIPDEFLEWFVKNSTCEEVIVEEVNIIDYSFPRSVRNEYKISIQREELLYHPELYDPEIGYYTKEGYKREVTGIDDNRPKPNYCYAKEHGNEKNCVFPVCHCGLPIKEQKQETPEEAAERYLKEENVTCLDVLENVITLDGIPFNQKERILNAFVKWQQEQSYSKKEVEDALIDISNYINTKELKDNSDLNFNEWIRKRDWFINYLFELLKKK
jgi:hypothetical protein